jgi:hypothetical protein
MEDGNVLPTATARPPAPKRSGPDNVALHDTHCRACNLEIHAGQLICRTSHGTYEHAHHHPIIGRQQQDRISEFDDEGVWTGVCPSCGTSHGGWPPGTLGGGLRCIRERAERAGAEDLVDQIDAFARDVTARRDEALRRPFDAHAWPH